MMRPLWKKVLAAIVAAALLPIAASAQELTVMTSGGFTAAVERLAPQYTRQTGVKVTTLLGPSMGETPQAIPNRLARGEHADVVIMVGSALQKLIDTGLVAPASRVELADSRIGMVVRSGTPKPKIDSVEHFKQTLLHADSVAYSDSASGVYIETTLFKKLRIEGPMMAKSKKIPRIPVATVVADGSYQLGFQQVAELLPVAGVQFVGKIPEPLQSITRYAAGVPVNAEHPEAAKRLLAYLQSGDAQAVARVTGLDPASPGACRHPSHQFRQFQRGRCQRPSAAFEDPYVARHLRFDQRHRRQHRMRAGRHCDRRHGGNTDAGLHQSQQRGDMPGLADARLVRRECRQRPIQQ